MRLTQKPVFIVIWSWSVLHLIVYITTTIPFFLRRNMFPIKGREVFLIMVERTLAFLQMLDIFLSFLQNRKCSMRVWVVSVTIHGIALVYICRAWKLLFMGNIAINLKEIAKSRKSAAINDDWFMRNRHLIKDEFFVKVFVVFVICWLAICGLFQGFNTAMREGRNCDKGHPIDTLNGVLCVIWAIILSVLAYKMRARDNDGLDIRRELGGIGMFAIVDTCFFVVTVVANREFIERNSLGAFPILIIYSVMSVYSILFPLSLTYKYEREKESITANVFKSLKACLNSKLGVDAFMGFLQTEFSSENLLFWLAVERYRTLPDDERLICAKQINNDYLERNSPLEVNLPDKARSKVRTQLEVLFQNEKQAVLGITMFDELQIEVFKLMESDSFPRFVAQVEGKKIDLDYYITKHSKAGNSRGGNSKVQLEILNLNDNKEMEASPSDDYDRVQTPSFEMGDIHPSAMIITTDRTPGGLHDKEDYVL